MLPFDDLLDLLPLPLLDFAEVQLGFESTECQVGGECQTGLCDGFFVGGGGFDQPPWGFLVGRRVGFDVI